jgi:hypothetical protein
MTRTPSTVPAVRPRWRSIIATFALAGALVATTSAMSATADVVGTGPGTISGTVTSTDGQPVAGASVSVSSASTDGGTTTDAFGYYELSGITLNDSTYFNVWANGYEAVPGHFETLTEASPTRQLDYILTPFETGVGTVSGHITGDGAPLAGLTVWASNNSTGQSVTAVSDENGFYVIADLPNGQWQIYTFAGNQYQTAQSPIVNITNSAPDASANIAFLSYPSGTSAITGVLTDALTGEPVPNVNISLSGTEVPQYGNDTTNTAGEFSFDSLPAGTFHLWFYAVGYLEFYEDIEVAVDETVTADRTLVAKNATASGHLQLANGTPIAGVWVQAQSINGNGGSGVSDENGDYVISDLGAVAYTLSVGGFGTPYDLKEKTITAVANGDVTANFTLVPRTTGSLIGYVYQPDGNAYLAPVCATLYSEKTKKAVAERYIDGEHYGADEFYFENLKPGKYTVEIRDCDDDPKTKFDKVFLGGVKKLKDATFVTIAAAEDSWGHGIEFAPRSH